MRDAFTLKSRSNAAETDVQPPIGLTESDPEFLSNLGRRVRDAREQRGMARKALARDAQVSERYLAQLEAGEGNASVVLLRRVAAALGLRIVDLLEFGQDIRVRRTRITLLCLRGSAKATLCQ